MGIYKNGHVALESEKPKIIAILYPINSHQKEITTILYVFHYPSSQKWTTQTKNPNLYTLPTTEKRHTLFFKHLCHHTHGWQPNHPKTLQFPQLKKSILFTHAPSSSLQGTQRPSHFTPSMPNASDNPTPSPSSPQDLKQAHNEDIPLLVSLAINWVFWLSLITKASNRKIKIKERSREEWRER